MTTEPTTTDAHEDHPDDYARDMAVGPFLDPDVKLTRQQAPRDGQHRLMAVLANEPASVEDPRTAALNASAADGRAATEPDAPPLCGEQVDTAIGTVTCDLPANHDLHGGGNRTYWKPGPPPTLFIMWLSDEHIRITLNDKVITEVNHDEHGWDGMTAAVVAATGVAQAFGSAIEELGTPNLDFDLTPPTSPKET
jgi:hypothetical protein